MLFRLDCDFDFFVEFGVLIVFKLEIVYGEVVEVFYILVHLESRGGILRIVENLLDNGDMAVIDVRVAYYVYEFTDFEIAHLREHMQQDRILHDVPVVCGEGVLTALIKNAVEFVAGDVESHRIGARVEMHLVQILKVVDVGEDASGLRIVFEVKKALCPLDRIRPRDICSFCRVDSRTLCQSSLFRPPSCPRCES